MNRIYRLVFNRRLGLWQAVSENARSRGKAARAVQAATLVAVALCPPFAHAAVVDWTNPSSTQSLWDMPLNWSTGASPTSSDDVRIGNNGNVLIIDLANANTLEMSGSSILQGSVSGSLAVQNGITLGNASNSTDQLIIADGLIVSSGGAVVVGAASGSISTIMLINGTLSLAAGQSLTLGSASGGSGILQIGNSVNAPAGVVSTDQAIQGFNNSLIIFNLPSSNSFSTQIGASGGNNAISVVQNGSGAIELTGTNYYTGGTTINAGALKVSSNANLGDAAGTLTFNGGTLETTGTFTMNRATTLNAGGGTFTVDSGTTLTQQGVISGTGALQVNGSGTLTLAGNNTYQGGTLITNATVKFSTANNFSSGGITLKDGTLAFIGASGTLNNINIKLNGTGTINVDGSSILGSPGGSVISDDGGVAGTLIKTGTGTLSLLGANTYSGGTAINGGTLQVNNASALGTGTLTINDGTLKWIINSYTVNNDVVLGTTRSTFDTGILNGTLNGNITGSTALTKIGTGTLTLAGANAYTGATNINAGTLQAGSADNAFGNNSAVTVASGATLDLNNFSETIGSLAGDGNVALGSGTLVTGGDGTDTTLSGSVSGSGGVAKLGTGNLSLTGNSVWGGDTYLRNGTFTVDGGSIQGTGTNATVMISMVGSGSANLVVKNGATADLAAGANVKTYIGTNDSGLSGAASEGSITVTGADSHLSIKNIWAGYGNGATGRISVDNGGKLTAWNFLDFGINGNAAGSATVTGSGSTLEVLGSGAFLMLASGGVNQATLTVADGGLVSTPETDLLSNGSAAGSVATLNLNGTSGARGTLETSVVTAGRAGRPAGSTANLVFDGGVLRASGANANFISGFTSGELITNDGGAFIDSNGFDIGIGTGFSGTGGLTKQGAGILTLSGASTYSGATTVAAGTLQAGAANNAFGNDSAVTVASDATLDLNGTNQAIGSLSGAGSVVLSGPLGYTLSMGANNASTTFSGTISGNNVSTLNKTGTGALILNGDNSGFYGHTEVAGGTLEVGDINSPSAVLGGNVTVDAAGTLRGHGITGTVTNNGTVAPGGSIGTLTVNGNYAQAANATLAIEVSPTAASKLLVNGPASLDGTLAIIYDPGTYSAKNYTIVQASSLGGTKFSTVTEGGKSNIGSLASAVVYGSGTVDLSLNGSAGGNGGNGGGTPVIIVPKQTGIYSALGTSALFGAQSANNTLLDRPGTGASGFNVDPWATLTGSYTSVDGNSTTPGFQSQRYGFIGGHDNTLDDGTTLGFALGYDHAEISQRDEASSGKTDVVRVAVYGNRAAGPVNLSATVGAGLDWLTQKRRFATGIAEGAHTGQEVTAGVQAALPLHFNAATTFTPKLGLRYAYFHANRFTENGAGGQDLSVGSDNAHSLQPYVGLTLDRSLGGDAESKKATLQVRMGYAYEALDTQRGLSVAAQDGTPFATTGVPLPRSYLTAGVGLTLHPRKNLDVSLNYDALVNTHHASSQQGSINMTYRF